MAKNILESIAHYIKNKTFNVVKVINSNNGFLCSDSNVQITILPINAYLPSDSQYLGVFNQIGTTCSATDTAILTGASVLEKNLTKYARIFTSSSAQNMSVYDVGYDGEDQIDKVTSIHKSVRPALVFDSLSDIPPTAIRDYNGVVRFVMGEYPQFAASQKIQEKLDFYICNPEEVSSPDEFSKTGKSYSFYCRQEGSEKLKLEQCEEYLHRGEKYVRIPSSIFNYYLTLSNDQMITVQKQEDVWVRVDPVTFVLNETKNSDGKYVAISENALVSGVPFDSISTNYSTSNLRLFTELRLLPEMLPEKAISPVYELDKGHHVLNGGVFSNVKGLKHVILPHSITKIDYNAFRNSEVEQVSYKSAGGKVITTIIPAGQSIDCVGSYGGGIIVYSKGEQPTSTSLTYLSKDGTISTVQGVNSQKIEELAKSNKLDLVFSWESAKQDLSNGIKRRAIPGGYIIEGLGTQPEIVKRYYETAATGANLLESQDWFKRLSHFDKTHVVRLFATLGGIDYDVNHQARVVSLLGEIKSYYGETFTNLLSRINLPTGLDHTRQSIIEYRHDSENKVVVKDGVAQIKRNKQASFSKQIFNFISEYYSHPNFDDVIHTLATKYYDVHNFYKNKLELANPDRHPGVNPDVYRRIMTIGISPELVQDYMFNCRYHTENAELQQTLSSIKLKYNLSADVVSRYDRLITEAKILEGRSQVLNSVTAEPVRLKYFVDSVEDTALDEDFSFVWPPLSSATAITIGQRLGTCFRVNGQNEAALINYITDKRDGLMLLFDSNNEPCGYCRVNYDVNNKGILIDTIDLSSGLALNKALHPKIWETFERCIMAMAAAMNLDGKYPVERISCKPDPYNKVLHIVQKKYMPASKLKAKILEERFYRTKQDVPYQKYYSQYLATEEQLVIASPELTAYNLAQKQNSREGDR